MFTYRKAVFHISRQLTLSVSSESHMCARGSMDRECHRFYEALTAGESASVFHRNWSVRLYLHHSCISCPWEYLVFFFFVFVRLREKVCVDAESVITGRERRMDRVIMDKGCCVCG